MQIKGLKRLKTFCDLLGLETLAQLEEFYKQHTNEGEAVITTLEKAVERMGL